MRNTYKDKKSVNLKMSEFQKILQHAKKLQRSEPSKKEMLYINPKPAVDEFKIKLLELPSDFAKPKMASIISKQRPSNKNSELSKKTVHVSKPSAEKKKVLGFKELMKLASEPKEVPPKPLDTLGSKSAERQRSEKKDHETEKQSITYRAKIKQEDSRTRMVQKHNKITPISNISNHRVPHHSSFSKTLQPKKRQKNIPRDLIKLNVKKRDLSTIEDIQNEILKRKGVVPKAPTNRPSGSTSHQNVTINTKSRENTGNSKSIYSSKSSQQEKRQRELSDNDSDSDSDIDTGHHPFPKKNTYSSEISKIFGYNRYRYDDDASSDDMEVGFNDLEREEKKRYFELMQFANWKTGR